MATVEIATLRGRPAGASISRFQTVSWPCVWALRPVESNGRDGGSKRVLPMSTVTCSSSPSSSTMTPVTISARSGLRADRPCSCTKRTKQRAPLPQCSTSLPSALKMR
ncbi:Uncharacterised protein [Bordetella pertussis]|nr:Uncharacterised protein [Bordetella pertussis]CFT90073.1 Uncharacterised protein [Bordetella pertussis]CFW60987.1 Uncharacterised protein [Bordetella pertussis]CPO98333.1 Uncharacterised protein [Bordetella pertussis]CPP57659.1 Uncharacterised protein [Bordetella pertussis]